MKTVLFLCFVLLCGDIALAQSAQANASASAQASGNSASANAAAQAAAQVNNGAASADASAAANANANGGSAQADASASASASAATIPATPIPATPVPAVAQADASASASASADAIAQASANAYAQTTPVALPYLPTVVAGTQVYSYPVSVALYPTSVTFDDKVFVCYNNQDCSALDYVYCNLAIPSGADGRGFCNACGDPYTITNPPSNVCCPSDVGPATCREGACVNGICVV